MSPQPIAHIVDYWRARWRDQPDDDTLELIMDLQDLMMLRAKTLLLGRGTRIISLDAFPLDEE